eukprot:431741-Amphidinium_carterae.1
MSLLSASQAFCQNLRFSSTADMNTTVVGVVCCNTFATDETSLAEIATDKAWKDVKTEMKRNQVVPPSQTENKLEVPNSEA